MSKHLTVLVGAACLFCTFGAFSRALDIQIKVMTYNVNRENIGDNDSYAREKMEDLAQYIVTNNIGIAGLQEMHDWEHAPWDRKNVRIDDADRLYEILKGKGYPMEMIMQPWKEKGNVDFRNVIYTKYPIIPGTFDSFEVRGRWVISAAFETPIGRVRIVNVHNQRKGTGDNDTCHQSDKIEKYVTSHYQSDFKNLILLGDYNAVLSTSSFCTTIPERFDFYCQKPCFRIDQIFSPKGSKFVLVNALEDKSKKHSDHYPQIAVLSSTETPQPTQPLTTVPEIDPAVPPPTYPPVIPTTAPTAIPQVIMSEYPPVENMVHPINNSSPSTVSSIDTDRHVLQRLISSPAEVVSSIDTTLKTPIRGVAILTKWDGQIEMWAQSWMALLLRMIGL